jgi:PadR family transcriptional regulator, regulatory protein PadR
MGSEIGPRITEQVVWVLALMLESPDASWYGLELARKTGIKTGTIYPLLARLEQAQWLTSDFEVADPAVEKRPRRRLYRLTGAGEASARQRMLEFEASSAPLRRTRRHAPRPQPRPLPEGGR